MKTKQFIFLALISIFSFLALAACTSPPEIDPEPAVEESVVEQVAQSTNAASTAAPEIAEVAEEVAVEPIQPTPEPIPQDYPTPDVIVPVQAIDSYPDPESGQLVTESGYPEPAAEVADASSTSREVIIPMRGEFALYGTLSTNGFNSPQPGVLLLHMLGGKRSDWADTGFDQQLVQQGYATLSLDLRGHGDSVSAVDWALAEEDLIMVWEWFTSQPEVDGENSMIIGASIGGNLALRTAANAPSVKAVVLLSPGLNYREVKTDDVIESIDRPVLLVAMTQDGYAADSVTQLNELNPDSSMAEIQDGSAHGTRMFGVYTGLEGLILDFLNANRG
ncbi:MAG: alpha/beta fold hydrolase [Anaerolineae bacterium]